MLKKFEEIRYTNKVVKNPKNNNIFLKFEFNIIWNFLLKYMVEFKSDKIA
jgi:hypothetical protein